MFVLKKIDLVSNWMAKRWIRKLSAVRPMVTFHAKLNGVFKKRGANFAAAVVWEAVHG